MAGIGCVGLKEERVRYASAGKLKALCSKPSGLALAGRGD